MKNSSIVPCALGKHGKFCTIWLKPGIPTEATSVKPPKIDMHHPTTIVVDDSFQTWRLFFYLSWALQTSNRQQQLLETAKNPAMKKCDRPGPRSRST
jgi:hypothetical protein